MIRRNRQQLDIPELQKKAEDEAIKIFGAKGTSALQDLILATIEAGIRQNGRIRKVVQDISR